LEENGSGWYENQTIVHPVGLAVLLVLCALVLVLPRRYALLPMFLLAALVPSAQRIAIASIDFSFMRILVIVAWIRLLARGTSRRRIHPLDHAFVGWASSEPSSPGASGFSAHLARRLGTRRSAYTSSSLLGRGWQTSRLALTI
jgi:hypothetical protein